jgi:hypothetical protein
MVQAIVRSNRPSETDGTEAVALGGIPNSGIIIMPPMSIEMTIPRTIIERPFPEALAK